MKKVRVKGVETVSRNVDVEVDPFDFLNSLKTSICGVPKDAYIDSEDGKVKTAEDISYHGSPLYEYKTYDVSKEKLAVLKSIINLQNSLKKLNK